MRDLAYDLAEYAAGVRFADLGPDVVETTKKFFLDTIAAALAGSSAPGCETVARHFSEEGGRPQSTIFVFGGRLPASNAALVNSMIAHAAEFDDTHDASTVHANATVIPAALATAERLGGIDGPSLITAIALGVDINCRLGLAIHGGTGWTPAVVFGYLGATAAAGKVLGFDAAHFHDALGISYSQCSGNRQCNVDRALVKRVQIGFAARAGVQACELAELGITGAKNIFEGAVGMGSLYFGGGFERDRVLDGIGNRFIGAELSIKPYPSARPTHGCIDAALALRTAYGLRPEDIREVVVHVTPLVMRSGGAPFNAANATQVEAQFSIAYTVAVALCRGGVFLEDFDDATIGGDRQVIDLAARVRVVRDQEPVGPGLTPVVMDVTTTDGATRSHRVDVITGNPRKPLSIEWVEDKFRRCAARSARPLPKADLDRFVALVKTLETLDDVSSLLPLLSAARANAAAPPS